MIQLWRRSLLGIILSLLSLAFGDAGQEVLAENAKRSNESLLWGPYRPNLYFGVRPRIPKSLTTGLLWAKVDSFQGVQNSRFAQIAIQSSYGHGLTYTKHCSLAPRFQTHL